MIYRGMDRPTLDKAYNNTKAVADFPAVYAGFQARSAAFYERTPGLRDRRYGPAPRQRYDLLPSGQPNAPTVIFIHGGYWQACSKEDFAFVAEGPLAHGYNAMIAEYTLAPEASMTQIVNEIGSLLTHIAASRDALGIGNGPVCLMGHSAGGHLTAVHRGNPLLAHAMPISPLVDLEPISLCWLNEKLQLSPEEIARYSPIEHIAAGCPTTVAVGAAELPELVRHAKEYAAAAAETGESARYIAVEGCDHFSVLEDLASRDGVLMQALVRGLAA